MAAEGSPLEQFQIERLIPLHIGSVDVSYTNSALLMTIAVVLIALLLIAGTSRSALVPGRWQSIAEMSYEFIAGMVDENIGHHGGREFFPLVFTIFMFVFFGNTLGLIPYSFTFTSHIIVTFALALFVFLLVTLVALFKHGIRFFTMFFPAGAPIFMAPILVPIEIVSYLSRPVSLSIRLFANMMAGHTMMAVFAGFTITLGIFGFFPIAINVALYALEVIVTALQAYVFTILTCLYLRDAVHLH
ncbi:MAG TPA: F0F1 ATP synthase subunit A [Stellaceae bacterium]|nr:F0F1 ATP synthase subunit A [Stellaceae bacterium]